jgi:hypothetical protein
MENQLVLVAKESGLETTQSQAILEKFTGLFEKAKEWETKAKLIKITDISQTKEMSEAREARLALKDVRVNAEKTRKELKEKSLREGKAIDGIANVIKALVVPIEEHLEKQEKFAENLEIERKAKIDAERSLELQKYVEDISLYNFKEMTDEVFNKLIDKVKASYEAEQEAIKKEEEERIKKEEEEKKEQERIKIENEKLKKEAEAREKELETERAEQEKKLEAERVKAKKEAEAREKIEAELKAKKDKEEKERKEAEEKIQAEKLAKLEEEKQAKLQPEKEKLIVFAESLKNIETPKELSVAGQAIVEEAEKKLLAISQEIKLKVKNL